MRFNLTWVCGDTSHSREIDGCYKLETKIQQLESFGYKNVTIFPIYDEVEESG